MKKLTLREHCKNKRRIVESWPEWKKSVMAWVKRSAAIITLFILTGCGALDVANDIADIWIGNGPVHHATVQSMTVGKESAVLFLDDGYNYEVQDADYVRPGDKVKIFETETGYRAEVDNE